MAAQYGSDSSGNGSILVNGVEKLKLRPDGMAIPAATASGDAARHDQVIGLGQTMTQFAIGAGAGQRDQLIYYYTGSKPRIVSVYVTTVSAAGGPLMEIDTIAANYLHGQVRDSCCSR